MFEFKASKPEGVRKAIAVMNRAVKANGNFCMLNWQLPKSDFLPIKKARNHKRRVEFRYGFGTLDYKRSETELHQCGSAACFAGYVAISPEFLEDGGYTGLGGSPNIMSPATAEFPGGEKYAGERAIAWWMGLSEQAAESLCAVESACTDGPMGLYSPFYGKRVIEVTSEDVLVKLRLLL